MAALLVVLDVPVLDLDHGGVFAVVEQPRIDRIFLSAFGLFQHCRPMRPVLYRLELDEALGQILLGHGAFDGVLFDQPVRSQHQEIARGVGRLVDAIHLRRIAGGGELHAGYILDAELPANVGLHLGDGIGHGAALLEGRIGALHLIHDRCDLGDVGAAEGVGRLLLAGISVTDGDAIALRLGCAEGGIMDAGVVAPAGRAAGKAGGEHCDQHAARHPYRPPRSRASGAEETTERGKRQAPAGHRRACFACLFSDVIGRAERLTFLGLKFQIDAERFPKNF